MRSESPESLPTGAATDGREACQAASHAETPHATHCGEDFPSAERAKPKELIAYSLSASAEGMAGQTINQLATPLLNIALGVNPAAISSLMAARGIFDAFTDPIFGQISDNFRSRWGRRRPFILGGSVLMALCLLGIWMFSTTWEPQAILVWFGVAIFALAVASTIFSVAHFALGIEMAPTYNERTRVVAYRSVVSKITGFLGPWIYPFCLLPLFGGEIFGARWVMAGFAVLIVLTGLWTFRACRERTQVSATRPKEKFLPAVKRIGSNPNFLRVTGIYMLMGSMLQLFGVFGLYLNIYYVFHGDKAAGASLNAVINTVAGILSLIAIPVITKLCATIQKHNTLRIALGLMLIGDILKWFVVRPEHPWAQMVLPFCFGLGISSVYVVLSSMQADLVDDDELISGQRREGLFACVSAWMMKSAGSLAAAASGFLIVWTGFDVNLGAAQSEQTIFLMRIFNSYAPGIMVALCFLLLYKYPLTKDRMNEIHDILVARRAEEKLREG